MNVAEAFNIREHFIATSSGRRTGGCEGVTDQNDAGLPVAGTDKGDGVRLQ
jgi:hypothetical protein